MAASASSSTYDNTTESLGRGKRSRPSWAAAARKSRAPTTMQLARSLKSLRRKVNDVEIKHYHERFNSVVATAGIFSLPRALTDPSEGTSDATRIGDEITLREVAIRCRFSETGTYSSGPIPVRVVVFRWTGNSEPLAQEIMEESGIFAGSSPIDVPYVEENSEYYKILDDKTWILTPGTGNEHLQQVYDFRRRYTNAKAKWNDDDNATKGHVFITFGADGVNPFVVNGFSLLKFADS